MLAFSARVVAKRLFSLCIGMVVSPPHCDRQKAMGIVRRRITGKYRRAILRRCLNRLPHLSRLGVANLSVRIANVITVFIGLVSRSKHSLSTEVKASRIGIGTKHSFCIFWRILETYRCRQPNLRRGRLGAGVPGGFPCFPLIAGSLPSDFPMVFFIKGVAKKLDRSEPLLKSLPHRLVIHIPSPWL